MTTSDTAVEVVTFGRSGVDLYRQRQLDLDAIRQAALLRITTTGMSEEPSRDAQANAAGAIVASRLECSTAMPTEAEITTLLDGGDPNAARP